MQEQSSKERPRAQVFRGELLGALVIYNSGSMHPPGDPWWTKWKGNVQNYEHALARASALLAAV